MSIAIFESVTTESALTELEAEGKKYDGLYVDMEDAPQRKYVKDKAAQIQGLIKKVNAHRVADKKAYGVKVEAQAAAIIERLSDANSPFQVLIDDYTVERKKILDAEKARVAAIEFQVQLDIDHEYALIMDENHAAKVTEELRLTAEREKQAIIDRDAYAAEQTKIAVDRLAALGKAQEQDKTNKENARLANKEHVQKVKTDIYNVLRTFELSDKNAKTVIHLATINELPNFTINY
ncbi:MAG: hypothetical protein Unbinned1520contig1002_36 [Prokaryotic dsDNA virus sp.]|nr:MAG: hypothetical protein Unbinned1520contig1002_36 [Prokaryotic dsDNA virus sp.]|tara:strand:+ start:8361 stop:9068 length:708 start_codon:yes stop_codon:yes gene_type:complete